MKKRLCAFSLAFALLISQMSATAVDITENDPTSTTQSETTDQNSSVNGSTDNAENTNTTSTAFSDMPQNEEDRLVLEHAVENGLLQGSDGKINPNGILTRAELATVMNRMLGLTKTADISSYTDVSSNSWYYPEMAKAVHGNLLQGSNKKLMPNKQLSRQETFVVVARVLCLSGGTSDDLSAFSDGKDLASWALDATGALAKSYTIPTVNGKLAPTESMTRLQFAHLMDHIICKMVKSSETSEHSDGAFFVCEPNLTLSNMTLDQDLILTPAASGTTTLNNVTVKGRIVILSGQLDCVDSTASQVVIASDLSKFDANSLLTSDSDHMTVEVMRECKNLTLSGRINNLDFSAHSGNYSIQNAQIESLDVDGNHNTILLDSNASATNIAVNGTNNTIKIQGKAEHADLNGASNTISGTGTLHGATLSARNCKVTVPGAIVTEDINYGIENAKLTLDAPTVKAGGSLTAKVTISGVPISTVTTAQWFVDGQELTGYKSPYFHAQNGVTSNIVRKLTFSKNMKTSAVVTFKLTSRNGVVRSVSKTVKIENYPSSYYDGQTNGVYNVLLGQYTTKFAASNKNRTTNLRVATKAINGKVVAAGETFSFNKVVGERTAARGYKNAMVIENGDYVPGLGGGVCQVSSTLFNAALLANMTITERYNHTLKSSYVPVGRDSTVAYGSKDFKFKNPYNQPIKIVASFNEKGTMTFSIYGTSGTSKPNTSLKVTGSGHSYTLTRTVNGTVNYTARSKYSN
jgi:hypothetical protein